MKTIGQSARVILACAILLIAVSAIAIAQPTQQGAPEAPAQPSMRMRGGQMMGGGPMMSGGMGMGPPRAMRGSAMGGMGMCGNGMGMGGMGMMQMMRSDPKTMGRMMELRGQMMELRSQMFHIMGDAMIRRGKELQKSK